MRPDRKAEYKIQQLTEAACAAFGVTRIEIESRSKRSTRKVRDARAAICYLLKEYNTIKLPNALLADHVGLGRAEISRLLNGMGVYVKHYDDIKEKVEHVAKSSPFLQDTFFVKQLRLFDTAA